MKKRIAFIVCALALLSACAPQVDTEEIAAMVAATLQAQQTLDAAAQPTSAPAGPGAIEGAVCYPSHSIPAMNVYFSKVGTLDAPLSFSIAENQSSYSFPVPEGTYLAYAWLPDLSLGGAYTKAIACGLTADCTNHDLVQFHVPAGETVTGIDLCDWYTDPGNIPGPDGNYYNPLEQSNTGSGQTGSGSTGVISGFLSYPSSFYPSMNVIAFDMNSDTFYYSTTSEGSNYYEIHNLPPSTYYVIAYLAGEDYAGAYTNAVPCGLSVDCTNHNYIPVLVNPGQTVTEVNPQDWYAPEGTFPANPLP